MYKKILNINLDYKWEKTDFVFPNTFPGHNYPAIYTWVLVSKSGAKSYYLGETENLSQRIYYYIKPGLSQKTNLRLNGLMKKSKNILLYVLNINSLVINGIEIKNNLLENKNIRNGLESFLIKELRTRKKKYTILNR